jgi:hypothetical protein
VNKVVRGIIGFVSFIIIGSIALYLVLRPSNALSVHNVLETLTESKVIIEDPASGIKELMIADLTNQDKCLLETSVKFFDLIDKKQKGVAFNQADLLLEYGWVALEVSARYIALDRAGLVNYCYATLPSKNEGVLKECEQLQTDQLLKHLDIGNTLSLEQANKIAIKTIQTLTNFKNSSFEKAFGSCIST